MHTFKAAFFCDRACLKKAWPRHKLVCKPPCPVVGPVPADEGSSSPNDIVTGRGGGGGNGFQGGPSSSSSSSECVVMEIAIRLTVASMLAYFYKRRLIYGDILV